MWDSSRIIDTMNVSSVKRKYHFQKDASLEREISSGTSTVCNPKKWFPIRTTSAKLAGCLLACFFPISFDRWAEWKKKILSLNKRECRTTQPVLDRADAFKIIQKMILAVPLLMVFSLFRHSTSAYRFSFALKWEEISFGGAWRKWEIKKCWKIYSSLFKVTTHRGSLVERLSRLQILEI